MAYAHFLFLAAQPQQREAETIDLLRRDRWPSPDGFGEVPKENLHLTLLPLMQTGKAANLAPTIRNVTAKLLGLPSEKAFDLRFELAKMMGPAGIVGRAPFALSLSRGRGAVNGLKRRLQSGLSDELHPAFARWKGGDPHVTLSWRLDRIERTVLETPVTWTLDEIVLIHSHRGESRYDVLARWPLTPFLLH